MFQLYIPIPWLFNNVRLTRYCVNRTWGLRSQNMVLCYVLFFWCTSWMEVWIYEPSICYWLEACYIWKINTYNVERALVSLSIIVFAFLDHPKFEQLFHELLKQYQSYLYLFECITHGHSKYGNEIPQFFSFFTTFFDIFWPVVCTGINNGN